MDKEKLQNNKKIHLAMPIGMGKSIMCDLDIVHLVDEELKKSFQVTVPLSAIAQLKDEKVTNLAKTTSINGFRPGKAPAAVIWKQYQDKITADLINAFVHESIIALKNHVKRDLILSPNVEIKKFSLEEGLEFDVSMELMPEIIFPEMTKITLTKPVYEIKDSDIEKRIEELANIRKNFISAEDAHEAKDGDQVVIDFEGRIDGVTFEGGTAKGHFLELGSKTFIEGFEEQLIGKKKGDKVEVKVTFPDNYNKKEFSGKPAEFSVVINEIRESKPFENHEELAKAMMFDNLDELKGKIKTSLERECDNHSKIKVKTQLFDHLDDNCKFSVPQKLLDEEFKVLWAQAEQYIKSGTKIDKSEEELKDEYTKLAERRVRLGILLSQLSNKYDIKIEQDDYINAVKAQINSQHPALSKQIIDYYSKNPKAVESLKGSILEEKTVDAILKEVSYKEENTAVSALLENVNN